MANPGVVAYALTAAVANGIAQSQTPGGAGALTLNGSLVSGGVAVLTSPNCPARRVAVTSTGADPTVVFTITGTNAGGNQITDTVTGVSTSTVNSTLDFATVTRVTSSAATVGAITVGTSATGSSPWLLQNIFVKAWALSVAVAITGTVTYTVEHTYDDPSGLSAFAPYQASIEPGSSVPPTVWPNATLTAKTTSAEAQYANQPIMAVRVTVTSGTGTAKLYAVQIGIGD